MRARIAARQAATGDAPERTPSARQVDRLEVGLLGLNGCNLAAAETPFGGVKQSGWGSEGGSEGVEGYLVTKFVSEEAVPPDAG